jgi:hypothetical protein
LLFHTVPHKEVEVAGARIGLAETVLMIDASGAYRAAVCFHMDNSTEQYLKVDLPAGAELWTATVAGEPVKPAADPEAAEGHCVWVPLVKTAPGEPDYAVVLKYGGKLEPLGRASSVSFPLIRTRPGTINIEQSLVRLRLPETYRWFDFGGTMRRVEDQADVTAGKVSYQTKQVQRLLEASRQSDPFARARAVNNLKQIGMAFHNFQERRTAGENDALRTQLKNRAEVMQQAEKQVEESEKAPAQAVLDNRSRINDLFAGRQATKSRNVLKDLGSNWLDVPEPEKPQQRPEEQQQGVNLNSGWLENNFTGGLAINSGTLGVAQQPQAGNSNTFSGSQTAPPPQSNSGALTLGNSIALAIPQQPTNPILSGDESEMGGQQQQAQQQLLRGKNNYLDDTERADVQRYKSKLHKKAMEQAKAPTGDEDAVFQHRGGGTPTAGPQNPIAASFAPATTPSAGQTGHAASDELGGFEYNAPAAVQPSGLASLDFPLPERGQVYNFITPRGDVSITAQAVAKDFISRWLRLGIALVVIAAVVYALRLAGQLGRRKARAADPAVPSPSGRG